ncbi:Nucleic acid-binding protein [Pyrenophora tritici-repentis]|nr:Nucleic acid-binding protein [Pyrenophora tritici-repentis]KAI1524737.1 RpsA Ribosomal protein S1 [Pyrenophora tritici-repentis]KAI1525112.1 RpsA Ribosomal protein S1 [Pyrenophora tritici-repentis]KAI1561011.1 RpsA Ribosomal protein S1 [Pyrenophora tritici-repentis]KAI1576621.1 RpsA Ribosomal protein S1 [Pyrenophora tritici-repentis]
MYCLSSLQIFDANCELRCLGILAKTGLVGDGCRTGFAMLCQNYKLFQGSTYADLLHGGDVFLRRSVCEMADAKDAFDSVSDIQGGAIVRLFEYSALHNVAGVERIESSFPVVVDGSRILARHQKLAFLRIDGYDAHFHNLTVCEVACSVVNEGLAHFRRWKPCLDIAIETYRGTVTTYAGQDTRTGQSFGKHLVVGPGLGI